MNESEFNAVALPELSDNDVRDLALKWEMALAECGMDGDGTDYRLTVSLLNAFTKLRKSYTTLLKRCSYESDNSADEASLVQSVFNEVREEIRKVDLSRTATPIKFIWDDEQKDFICRQQDGTVGITAEVEASAVNICGEIQTRLELFDRQLHELKISKENRKELAEKSDAELSEICLQHADDGDLWSGTAEVLQECARRLKTTHI